MRVRRYAALLAWTFLAARAVAAPVDPDEAESDTGVSRAKPLTGAALKKELERQEQLQRKKEEREHEEKMKYFHEPGRDDLLGHYDVRYFHGLVSYEERTHTLTHMIRAYLDFFRDKGLETWIAHGTLLGWWWNGKMLPWDWDVDTQVSGATLAHLAAHHNRTLHEYMSPEGSVRRTYLLDVNPWQRERERGDGFNIIDARWIDTHNGLYIDITGLSETEPEEHPGVWNCKNFHSYRVSDLYPLRESVYEGVKAMIPFAYEKILKEEYKTKSLSLDYYEGHRWNLTLGEWVKTPELIEKEEKERAMKEEAKLMKEEAAEQDTRHFWK